MKLTESLHEVYEPDWYGREDVKMVGEVRAREPVVLSKHSESRQSLLKFFILSEKARHNHIVFKGTYLK